MSSIMNPVKDLVLLSYEKDLRYGSISGIFVIDREVLDNLLEVNPLIDFGEVCGKHSEVYKRFKELDLKILSEDFETIVGFAKTMLIDLSDGIDKEDKYVSLHGTSPFGVSEDFLYELDQSED